MCPDIHGGELQPIRQNGSAQAHGADLVKSVGLIEIFLAVPWKDWELLVISGNVILRLQPVEGVCSSEPCGRVCTEKAASSVYLEWHSCLALLVWF